MKRLQLIFLYLILSLPITYGQSAQGRYASRMTTDGMIYFIDPHKLTQLSNIKRFEYDMTLLSWTDSVTVNFTFESESMVIPEKFQIESCESIFPCKDYSSLFIDIKKKHFEIRITSKFPINVLEQILQCDESPVFSFTQQGKIINASYKKNTWSKDRKKISDIFNIYQYSKK